MTFESALKFIEEAFKRRADIQTGENIWEYTEAPESEWDDEIKAEFACDLCNWMERGDYIGIIEKSGEKLSYDELHIEG